MLLIWLPVEFRWMYRLFPYPPPLTHTLTILIALGTGVAAFVLDGLVRDIAESRERRFPIFGRGVIPMPGAKSKLGELNVPVRCGGVGGAPGDIVVGDERGIGVGAREGAAQGRGCGERQNAEAGKGERREAGIARDFHWRWRLHMAERVAGQLEGARFGVQAVYLLGSAHNATCRAGGAIDPPVPHDRPRRHRPHRRNRSRLR